ncbi:MAG: acetyl-CoA C-acyltransferase, partial [Blastocatellia bacterium]
MHDAVIVSSVRTAVGKAPKGTLRSTRPDEMAATVLRGALERAPGLDPREIDDVILGCAMPEAEQGMNVARIASLRAGLPIECSAMTVNRFCSSGLQTIAMASERIMVGGATAILAGGTETMSLIPMGGHRIVPNPRLVDTYPDAYLNMGLTAERVANRYGITREDQDAFALASHQKAFAAIAEGRFTGEIVPLEVTVDSLNAKGKKQSKTVSFTVDEGPRSDSTAEALAKLRPAFHVKGTVTAGNSSQMSDGAAAALVMNGDRARELGLTPLGR